MERGDLIFVAKLAEHAERYEDMVERMKEMVKTGSGDLSLEERNLLSVAFKNVIGVRRASWRTVSSIEHKQQATQEPTLDTVKSYREEIEKEVKDIAEDILSVLEELIQKGTEAESKVFYLKMKGDYYRYLAEFATGQDRRNAAESSLSAYKLASEAASTSLVAIHPIRLGLALNFSVFYYEILNNPEKACGLAKTAFDGAVEEMDSIEEDSYRDSPLIMQLLRDNLSLWTTDVGGGEEGDDAEEGADEAEEKSKE